MLFLVLGALAAAAALYAAYNLAVVVSRPYRSKLRHLPGPKKGNNVLFGAIFQILKLQAMEPQLRWMAEYPDAPLLWYRFLFNTDRLLVTDPELVKEVLVRQERVFTKTARAYTSLKAMLGDGLVTQLGDVHAQHRKLVNPAFKHGALRAMADMMVAQSKAYVAELARRRVTAEAEGRPLRAAVAEDFNHLTLNIIGLGAFGFDFESFHSGPEPSVGQVASERFHRILAGRSQLLMFSMTVLPFLAYLPLPSLLELGRNQRYTDELVKSMIAQKRAARTASAERPPATDLLELLVDTRDEETGAELSDDDLVAHIKTFLFAGHETTSTLLNWTVYELSQAPDVLRRIREELDKVVGDRDVAYADLDKLVYLAAVLKEVLRKDPPVAIVTRIAAQDAMLGDTLVPKGSGIVISPYILHHNPKLWEDPEKFDPERWLAKDGVKKKYHAYQYIPFLLGPRNCIGSKFALMEAKIILATVLRSATFTMSREAYDRTERTLAVTMRPRPPLDMEVAQA